MFTVMRRKARAKAMPCSVVHSAFTFRKFSRIYARRVALRR